MAESKDKYLELLDLLARLDEECQQLDLRERAGWKALRERLCALRAKINALDRGSDGGEEPD